MAFQVGVKPDFFHRISDLVLAYLVVQARKQLEIFVPRVVRDKPRRFNDYAHILWKVNVFAHTFFVNGYLTVCGFDEPTDTFHKHRFARAIPTDKSVNLALLKVNVYVFEYLRFAKCQAHVFDRNNSHIYSTNSMLYNCSLRAAQALSDSSTVIAVAKYAYEHHTGKFLRESISS